MSRRRAVAVNKADVTVSSVRGNAMCRGREETLSRVREAESPWEGSGKLLQL